MHSIAWHIGQRCSLCSLHVASDWLTICRSLHTSSISQVSTDEAREAKKERRRRRRDVNRNLKSWTEGAFGAGPQVFTKHENSNKSEPKQKIEADDSSTHTNSTDEADRMWRRLLKQTRSSSEAARLRRAWEQWRTTMDQASYRFQREASSSAQEREFSNKKNSTGPKDKNNTNFQNGSNGSSSFSTDDWSAAWEEAFSSATTYSSYSNFNSDYENSWTYGSDPRSQASASWQQQQREQKQREPAGNVHPNWSRQHRPHSQRSTFVLSKEVQLNLSLLGLATTHLPTSLELKTAFRSSAMLNHPDKHQADPKAASRAEEKFKQVQAAFLFLKTMLVVV